MKNVRQSHTTEFKGEPNKTADKPHKKISEILL